MTFLQKARERATEVAREAADASARAADAVSAKAHDPDTQARFRQIAETASAKAHDPESQARVRAGLAAAGRKTRTAVERIDPGILADVIIKATALQERANAQLRSKGSIYRIGEIQVTASLPPSISFSIERVSEHESADLGEHALRSSSEIVASQRVRDAGATDAESGPETTILSLDGAEQAAIESSLAETGFAMSETVDALVGASGSDAEAAAGAATDGAERATV